MGWLHLFIAVFLPLSVMAAEPPCHGPLADVLLTEGQKKMAAEIEQRWNDSIANNHHQRAIESLLFFTLEDTKAAKVLNQLGFQRDKQAKTLSYPANPWKFLESAKGFKIRPGIAIQKKFSYDIHFITSLEDIPSDPDNWIYEVRELPNPEYYGALQKGILPITISTLFEDHEFQHLISLYHPDVPEYMNVLQKQAELFLAGKLNQKLAFLNLEVFAFIRPATRAQFTAFVQKHQLKTSSFKELRQQIELLTISEIEILSKQFLEMYPSLVLYLGGLIRDSQLVPGKTLHETGYSFLENWKSSRNQKSNLVDRFLQQNWRTLYGQLVFTHNLLYRTPIDYSISSAHMGLSILDLEQLNLKRPRSIDQRQVINYLTMALAEMIHGVQLAFNLNMAPAAVSAAVIDVTHPDHPKVRAFFEQAYTAVHENNAKSTSIYYRAFIELEERARLRSILKGN